MRGPGPHEMIDGPTPRGGRGCVPQAHLDGSERLKPYEKFATMIIDRPWDDIAAYCQSANKVALGFVEGLSNKIGYPDLRVF